jgi:molybdenum cofactor cytidylyltransferase
VPASPQAQQNIAARKVERSIRGTRHGIHIKSAIRVFPANIAETTGLLSMKPRGIGRVGAIILAAGSSTRMGKAKQLLPLGDRTVLEQTIANVRGAEVNEIVLVLGASAEIIRRQLPLSLLKRLKVVVNQAHGEGMSSSLRAGISALDEKTEAALIILGDQPFIRPQTMDQVISAYRRNQAQIVIPSFQGSRGNPVLLDRSVFSEVMALEGDTGCRAIFGNHLGGITKVEVEDEGVLLDIDDPDDYDRVRGKGSSA